MRNLGQIYEVNINDIEQGIAVVKKYERMFNIFNKWVTDMENVGQVRHTHQDQLNVQKVIEFLSLFDHAGKQVIVNIDNDLPF